MEEKLIIRKHLGWRLVYIPKERLWQWKVFFNGMGVWGNKAECCRQTKVSRATIDLVLNKGYCTKRVYNKINNFFEENKNKNEEYENITK